MKSGFPKWNKLLILLILTAIFSAFTWKLVSATDDDPPVRTSTIQIESTLYRWWLVYWSNNSVACDFYIEHKGNPTNLEIQQKCGQSLFKLWANTPSCEYSTSKKCTGLYLHNINSTPVQKPMEVKGSPPSISLSLSGCDYQGEDDHCIGYPALTFTGVEPLPNQKIVRIYGSIGDTNFRCENFDCPIPLPVTDDQGVMITFKGDSSFGDSTVEYTAYARVLPADAGSDSYYVDVVSTQWNGRAAPPCTAIWGVYPETRNLPGWLVTPQTSSDLATSQKLYYLSAALINVQAVDASTCDNGGLQSASIANECGVTAARSTSQEWQNRFDEIILAEAKSSNVPAFLIKNLITRESQFWPGKYPGNKEVGLAQITENGADTVLLWNRSFFDVFCPTVFSPTGCSKGYALMKSTYQETLKGALLQSVNAACPDCEYGVDMSKAEYTIFVLAEMLKADCGQVDQLIRNITGESPRGIATYSDLWRFTLVNYNGGAGCLGDALKRTWNANSPLDWQHVAPNLDGDCQSAVDYVVDVTNGNTREVLIYSTPVPTEEESASMVSSTITISPTPIGTMTQTPTASVTPTDEPTAEPTITATPTITPTATESE